MLFLGGRSTEGDARRFSCSFQSVFFAFASSCFQLSLQLHRPFIKPLFCFLARIACTKNALLSTKCHHLSSSAFKSIKYLGTLNLTNLFFAPPPLFTHTKRWPELACRQLDLGPRHSTGEKTLPTAHLCQPDYVLGQHVQLHLRQLNIFASCSKLPLHFVSFGHPKLYAYFVAYPSLVKNDSFVPNYSDTNPCRLHTQGPLQERKNRNS
jgi:hypothetical protein